MSPRTRMGVPRTWALAVGGMVGGGIFSVLGVVVDVAGRWAWLSFVLAGLVILATVPSYTGLVARFHEGGGAFTFLREIGREGLAGAVSWLLVIGYVLTIAVYASTFGHYTAEVVGFPGAWVRVLAVALVAVIVLLNLLGAGEVSGVELVTVTIELVLLLGLAVIGVSRWAPEQLGAGVEPRGPVQALVGAAAIFMAYEGWQLLTYDYRDIDDPERTLPRGLLTAVIVVIVVYLGVAIGSVFLISAGTIVERSTTALAEAGRAALGSWGVGAVSVAAGLATASAINATLFATAQLADDVAADGELPAWFDARNGRGVPHRAVTVLGSLAALLAATGSLGTLVEAASLAFLFTFGSVNLLAAILGSGLRRLLASAAVIGTATLFVAGTYRLLQEAPTALGVLGAFVLVAVAGRPLLLRHVRVEEGPDR